MNTTTTRRCTTALLSGALAAVIALTGCGDDSSSSDEAESGTTAAGEAGVFPATVDTAYGEVTVDDDPERIVVLSTTYLELLPYLDEVPFASTEDDAAIMSYTPWLEEVERGEVHVDLVDAEYLPAPEAIAELEPDLILTDIWSADEALYEQLSQVAPTYVGIDTDTNTSWQDNLAALATLTGHDPAVVEEVEADFAATMADAAAALPGLQGATFQVAALGADDQLWLTEYANAPLLGLGLTPGEGQPTTGAEGADPPKYSQENIDQLDGEVLVLATDHRDPEGTWRTALEADPRLGELPASQNGTLLYVTGPEWAALNGGSPISVGWWLEGALPTLEGSALNQGAG